MLISLCRTFIVLQLHQILIDFRNSFTGQISDEFEVSKIPSDPKVIVKRSQLYEILKVTLQLSAMCDVLHWLSGLTLSCATLF